MVWFAHRGAEWAPLLRSLAADAYICIMVWDLIGSHRIQDAMGAGGETAKLVASINRAIDRSSLMQKHHDDSKACLTAFVQDNTAIAVIEVTAA
jgi:hypothetical protein